MRGEWEAFTKSDHTIHSSVSAAKCRFTFPHHHNSDERHKCYSMCLNAFISTQSFQSREFTLGLPFEIKRTQGKHILTKFAWSPQPASGTHVSESVLRADVLQNLSTEQFSKITSSQTPTQNTDENSSRQQGAQKAFKQRKKSSWRWLISFHKKLIPEQCKARGAGCHELLSQYKHCTEILP